MFPSTRRCLTGIRIAALGCGLPLIVWWAAREATLAGGWHAGLVPGIVLSQIAMLVYALRFRSVMRLVGIDLGVLETLRIATLGLFYQCFVPFAAGADLTKFLKLKARDHATAPVATGIVLDHLIGFVVLALLAAVSFARYRPIEMTVDPARSLIALLAIVGLTVAVGRRLVRRHLTAIRPVYGLVAGQRRRIATAVLLAGVMHVLIAGAVWSAASSFALPIDYPTVLFVLSAASLFQAIPAQLFGIGIAEAAATGLYVAVGLSPVAALLLTSVLVGYRLLMALIGGLWDLWPTTPRTPAGHDRVPRAGSL
jgi:uncharacterized membrane protein YbhN (UPF0104 family)